jgi:hypothetical protein
VFALGYFDEFAANFSESSLMAFKKSSKVVKKI